MTLNNNQWQALKLGGVPKSTRATSSISTFINWLVKGSIMASIGMGGVFAYLHYQQADQSISQAAIAEVSSSKGTESTLIATIIAPPPRKRFSQIRMHELPSTKPGSTPSLWKALEEGAYLDN